MEEITSLQNPGVKEVVRLRDLRERDKSSLFIIEGYRELLRAVDAGVKLHRLYICPQFFLGSNEEALIQRAQCLTLSCSESVFQKISYRDRPDGLLAIAFRHGLPLAQLPFKENPLYVVAEAIEKPGNLGTILRSSDAVGATAVIVCDRCTDLYNPNVVRSSVGTLFTIPVAEGSSEETLAFLRARNVKVVAGTPGATTLYTEADLTGPLAIALGTEQLGLSQRWMEEADLQVRIPMCGVADSLNVATATTVLLYEALRQRKLQRN
ncbi:MAG: RNA methyltransferase [Verrucomicrobia bacterium]|nr:RNA methyltransferase [Verrucomicrobiota bacterium]